MTNNEYYYAVSHEQRYRLVIDSKLWGYMMALTVLSAPNEILGIGMMTKKCVGYNTDFIVDEIFIPKQEVAANCCSFADGAQNEIMNKILERGDNTERLCFRWHSHGNGPVFFSAIDEKDIDNCSFPYVVNLVVNVNQDSVARLDVLNPVRIRNIPLKIHINAEVRDAERAECMREIREKCKKNFIECKEGRSISLEGVTVKS